MVELRALGCAGLYRDGVAIEGRAAQRHGIALLALLAASAGGVSRDKLIGCLWPEMDARRARHRLSVAIHVLRRELGADILHTAGDGVSLNLEVVTTDVGCFVEAVTTGRLGEAAELYRGPFLDGFFLSNASEFEHWVEAERARLAGLYHAALERLVAEAEARGDQRKAAQWWERLAIHDPFSASAALGHMRAVAALGDLASAIRHARAYAALLEAELDIPPDPEIIALAEELTNQAQARLRQERTSQSAPGARAQVAPFGRAGRRWGLQPRGVLLSAAGITLVLVGAAWTMSRGLRAVPAGAAPVLVVDFGTGPTTPDTLGGVLAASIAGSLEIVPQLRSRVRTASANEAGRMRRQGGLHRITGTIDVRGARTTARVELREAGSQEGSWTRTLETATGTLDGLIEELSLEISLELRERLATYVPKEYTESRRAYDRFLMGVYAMRRATSEDVWQALQFHREGWEEDPEFALAHAIAGNAYIWLIGRGVTPQVGFDLAREHVVESLAIDSTLAEGHAALGYLQIWGDWDFEAGEASLRKAMLLYPTLPQAHGWYGFYQLYVRNRPEPAVRHVRRSLDLDPLNTGRSRDVELALYRARRYEEVEAQHDVTFSLDADVARSLRGSPLGQAYREMGRHEESVALFEELRERLGTTGTGVAIVYGRMGRVEEALAIAAELEAGPGGGAPLQLARIYANAGEIDRAFERLNAARHERPDQILQIVADPAFDPLREDSRFEALLAEIGIPR